MEKLRKIDYVKMPNPNEIHPEFAYVGLLEMHFDTSGLMGLWNRRDRWEIASRDPVKYKALVKESIPAVAQELYRYYPNWNPDRVAEHILDQELRMGPPQEKSHKELRFKAFKDKLQKTLWTRIVQELGSTAPIHEMTDEQQKQFIQKQLERLRATSGSNSQSGALMPKI